MAAAFDLDLAGLDVLEIGPGIGAGAILASRLSGRVVHSYDMPEMRAVQGVVHNLYCRHTGFPRERFTYLASVDEIERRLSGRDYAVLSFWAFSEMPPALREQFDDAIERSRFALFAANASFEGVDNEAYFSQLAGQVGRTHRTAPLPLQGMPSYMQRHRLHLIY